MNLTASRLLTIVSFACFFIAALTVAFALGIGPALAWAFGGFAAWKLAEVV